MQFSAESILSSSVSAHEVSVPSSSSNILFYQYNSIHNSFAVPIEPAKTSIAMAKVFVIVKGIQEAASGQESDMIEQSLVRWCSASRTKNDG